MSVVVVDAGSLKSTRSSIASAPLTRRVELPAETDCANVVVPAVFAISYMRKVVSVRSPPLY